MEFMYVKCVVLRRALGGLYTDYKNMRSMNNIQVRSLSPTVGLTFSALRSWYTKTTSEKIQGLMEVER